MTRGLSTGEPPDPSSGSQSCRGDWGPGPHTVELAPAWLGLSTPRAILWQGRRPCEDRLGRDRGWIDYSYLR
jgi:hypothetical protein